MNNENIPQTRRRMCFHLPYLPPPLASLKPKRGVGQPALGLFRRCINFVQVLFGVFGVVCPETLSLPERRMGVVIVVCASLCVLGAFDSQSGPGRRLVGQCRLPVFPTSMAAPPAQGHVSTSALRLASIHGCPRLTKYRVIAGDRNCEIETAGFLRRK